MTDICEENTFPTILEDISSGLSSKVLDLEDILENLRIQTTDLNVQLNEAQSEYENQNEEIAKNDKTISNLDNKNADLEEKYKNISEAFSEAQNDKEALKEKVAELEDSMKEHSEVFENKCNSLLEKCKELEGFLEAKTEEKDDLEQNLNEKIDVIRECEERIELLERQDEDKTEKYDKKSEAYKALKQRFLAEKKKWNSKKSSQKYMIQDLTNKLKLANQRFDNISGEIELMSTWFLKIANVFEECKEISNIDSISGGKQSFQAPPRRKAPRSQSQTPTRRNVPSSPSSINLSVPDILIAGKEDDDDILSECYEEHSVKNVYITTPPKKSDEDKESKATDHHSFKSAVSFEEPKRSDESIESEENKESDDEQDDECSNNLKMAATEETSQSTLPPNVEINVDTSQEVGVETVEIDNKLLRWFK